MLRGPQEPSHNTVKGEIGTIENRQHVRVFLETSGELKVPDTDEAFLCTVVNVSDGGIQLAFRGTSSPPTLDTQSVFIKFKVGSEYTLEATFVWDGILDKRYRAGFEWTCKDDSQLQRLRVELMRLAVQRRRLRR